MVDRYTGKKLDDRYEIHELLGCGGMAMVYSAYDTVNKRTVAIKILKDEFSGNEDFIRRFKNESKTIAMLSHNNIVKVYDVSFGDKIQYIVMEYIDGITLKEYIDKQHTIKWKEAVHFTTQILQALSHAHEKGVIHRDIKPQNIMLLRDGTIKVTDFGIAKFSKYETRTMTDKAIGSVHYISPEQARGDLTDEKTDVYSVGVLLYEMLTGTLPFEAENAVSVAIMQLQSNPKPLREVNPDIPEGLEEITLKAMQKNPKYRYDSAEDMLFAIGQFQKNLSVRFEYKYFNDDNPTKYIDAVNSVKDARHKLNYGDEYLDEDDKEKSSKAINIVIGVGIAIVILSVILISGLLTGWFGLGAKDVDVPNFVGMKVTEVADNKDYKFTWEIKYAYDSSKEEGIIIDQDPKAGSKRVKENSKIVLVVNSSGTKVAVPAVKGKTAEVAMAELKDVGLLYEILKVEDSETAEGIVVGTDPQEGKEITVNSIVKVFVSRGAGDKKVTIPNVINKTLSEATAELVSKGLKVSENIIKENSSKAKDVVLSTNPLPGIEVEEGSTITLTVSSGEVAKKTISIYVDLPASVTKEVSLKVYIDGVLDTDHSKTLVPAYNTTYTLPVTGASGKKSVVVNLDGKQYRAYEVDFDQGTVKTIAAYAYTSVSNKNTSSNSTPSFSSNSSTFSDARERNEVKTKVVKKGNTRTNNRGY
ncbi:MAG: Serine/threonine-protein kinase PrkC [Eubacteriales bacterium SKADARSKE-1]|nr:Serine/threonine-protein kinase PrkC [Eubacteriales bacterium SKADARSKE-1]